MFDSSNTATIKNGPFGTICLLGETEGQETRNDAKQTQHVVVRIGVNDRMLSAGPRIDQRNDKRALRLTRDALPHQTTTNATDHLNNTHGSAANLLVADVRHNDHHHATPHFSSTVSREDDGPHQRQKDVVRHQHRELDLALTGRGGATSVSAVRSASTSGVTRIQSENTRMKTPSKERYSHKRLITGISSAIPITPARLTYPGRAGRARRSR